MKKNGIGKNLLYLIQGALVGVGAILPGVSGGVLCVAFGTYEPMMEFLTTPRQALKKHYRLFIPFVIGWAVGFALLAKGVEVLFSASATVAVMLFFGLICGTLPELFKTTEKSDPSKSWTPFVMTLALAYMGLHFLENGFSLVVPPCFWSYFLCGALWGLSLILPGLSSASILICLGLYEPMTTGLVALDFRVILPMLLGIVVMVLLFARLVNMLFKKHNAVITRVVLGFVIASSLKIVPASFAGPVELIVSIACFFGGFALARAMDMPQFKKENQ